ncbi:CoxG family protein [Falsiroseomonas oryzae]|uniref:CoxG family protein n=1 Tax=Falsiroseomonas oryzae TaxID=2766473 RepID=UPI0022EA54B0|nr:SRPBCC domain-containing protein [Roseomonas sp. MO-31]
MRIEGAFPVPAPLPAVWAAILDPEVVGPCIPGCSAIEVLSPTEYRATVRVSVGPIGTSFNVVVTVTEMEEHARIASVTRGEEGSRASLLTAQNLLLVRGTEDGGTEVAYASEVSISGRLGKFGLGLMRKKAAELATTFATNLSARLAPPGCGGPMTGGAAAPEV